MLNQEQLSCYQAQANVLYHALYFEPSEFLLGQFRENDVAKSWPETGEQSCRSRGLALLEQALTESDDALLPQLKIDYTQLFLGPGELSAIPWGSPYLHEKRLLCGPSTEAFAAFCQHHGIQVSTQSKEPIDHIGLMLSVLGSLFAEELKQENGVPEKVAEDLLREHLLPWSGRFCELMVEGAQTPYYQGIALLVSSLLEGLKQELDISPLSLQLFR